MPGYRFFKSADKAQDSIWVYTLQQHGKTQATQYIKGLHKHLAALAARKKPWRHLPAHLQIRQSIGLIYISKYESHYIFFRELPERNIGVLSLLHEKMDMPSQIAAILKLPEEP